MDRAWEIEQESWESLAGGRGPGPWAARYMASDGFVVLPNRVVSRDDLVGGWTNRSSLRSWAALEPDFTVVDGGNLVIRYEIKFDAEWLPDYEGFVTALYAAGVPDWTLICRVHTPKGSFPF
jgi:hypothetical protein